MKNILFTLIIALAIACNNKPFDKAKETESIKKLLFSQQKSWNDGSLLDFMQAYAKLDSISFIGSRGVKYGWKNTLETYKRGYPNKDYMGKLSFELNHINILNTDNAFVIGRFYLTRKDSIGDASGTFSLLLTKINDRWKIISDHTSADKK